MNPVFNTPVLQQQGQAIWNIHPALTDPWGDLVHCGTEGDALQEQLIENPALLNKLRGGMEAEMAYVSWKDGEFGLLYQVEYVSEETVDPSLGFPADQLRPYKDVVQSIAHKAASLEDEFPGIAACAAHPEHVVDLEGDPALWVFIPESILGTDKANSLIESII